MTLLVHFLQKPFKTNHMNTELETSHSAPTPSNNNNNKQENNAGSNMVKDPDNWTTGDEEMTGAQKSYLKTLSDEAGEAFDENLTKAEASKKINELQQKTGRGLDKGNG